MIHPLVIFHLTFELLLLFLVYVLIIQDSQNIKCIIKYILIPIS